MSKLNWNYDEVKKGATEEGFTTLTTGPQIVKILKAEDIEEKQYLKIYLDIAEGALKDYFKEMYDRNTYDEKKWPNQATLYRSYKDSAKYFFAGFITAVEKSNDGFVFNPDKDWGQQLKGKLFVANFGEQEYISDETDSNSKLIVKTIPKIIETRSIKALKEGKVEAPKLTKLGKSDFEYKGVGEEDITRTPDMQASDTQEHYNNVEEDLPF